MKRAVSVSIGSSTRDNEAVLTILGEEVRGRADLVALGVGDHALVLGQLRRQGAHAEQVAQRVAGKISVPGEAVLQDCRPRLAPLVVAAQRRERHAQVTRRQHVVLLPDAPARATVVGHCHDGGEVVGQPAQIADGCRLGLGRVAVGAHGVNIPLAGSIALTGIFFLLIMLIQKEVSSSADRGRHQRLSRFLNIGIVPLLLAFLLTAFVKIVQVLD